MYSRFPTYQFSQPDKGYDEKTQPSNPNSSPIPSWSEYSGSWVNPNTDYIDRKIEPRYSSSLSTATGVKRSSDDWNQLSELLPPTKKKILDFEDGESSEMGVSKKSPQVIDYGHGKLNAPINDPIADQSTSTKPRFRSRSPSVSAQKKSKCAPTISNRKLYRLFTDALTVMIHTDQSVQTILNFDEELNNVLSPILEGSDMNAVVKSLGNGQHLVASKRLWRLVQITKYKIKSVWLEITGQTKNSELISQIITSFLAAMKRNNQDDKNRKDNSGLNCSLPALSKNFERFSETGPAKDPKKGTTAMTRFKSTMKKKTCLQPRCPKKINLQTKKEMKAKNEKTTTPTPSDSLSKKTLFLSSGAVNSTDQLDQNIPMTVQNQQSYPKQDPVEQEWKFLKEKYSNEGHDKHQFEQNVSQMPPHEQLVLLSYYIRRLELSSKSFVSNMEKLLDNYRKWGVNITYEEAKHSYFIFGTLKIAGFFITRRRACTKHRLITRVYERAHFILLKYPASKIIEFGDPNADGADELRLEYFPLMDLITQLKNTYNQLEQPEKVGVEKIMASGLINSLLLASMKYDEIGIIPNNPKYIAWLKLGSSTISVGYGTSLSIAKKNANCAAIERLRFVPAHEIVYELGDLEMKEAEVKSVNVSNPKEKVEEHNPKNVLSMVRKTEESDKKVESNEGLENLDRKTEVNIEEVDSRKKPEKQAMNVGKTENTTIAVKPACQTSGDKPKTVQNQQSKPVSSRGGLQPEGQIQVLIKDDAKSLNEENSDQGNNERLNAKENKLEISEMPPQEQLAHLVNHLQFSELPLEFKYKFMSSLIDNYKKMGVNITYEEVIQSEILFGTLKIAGFFITRCKEISKKHSLKKKVYTRALSNLLKFPASMIIEFGDPNADGADELRVERFSLMALITQLKNTYNQIKLPEEVEVKTIMASGLINSSFPASIRYNEISINPNNPKYIACLMLGFCTIGVGYGASPTIAKKNANYAAVERLRFAPAYKIVYELGDLEMKKAEVKSVNVIDSTEKVEEHNPKNVLSMVRKTEESDKKVESNEGLENLDRQSEVKIEEVDSREKPEKQAMNVEKTENITIAMESKEELQKLNRNGGKTVKKFDKIDSKKESEKLMKKIQESEKSVPEVDSEKPFLKVKEAKKVVLKLRLKTETRMALKPEKVEKDFKETEAEKLAVIGEIQAEKDLDVNKAGIVGGKVENVGKEDQNVEDIRKEDQNVEDIRKEDQNVEDIRKEDQYVEDIRKEDQNCEDIRKEDQNVEDIRKEDQNVEDIRKEDQNVEDIRKEDQNVEDIRKEDQNLEDIIKEYPNGEDIGKAEEIKDSEKVCEKVNQPDLTYEGDDGGMGNVAEKINVDKESERINKVEMGDIINEGELGERITEGELDEIITDTKVGDGVNQAEVGDRITEAEVGDGISEAELGERITETEVGDGISEAELGERITETEVGDGISEADVGEIEITETEVGDGITETEVGDGLTKTEVGDGLTETEVSDGITETDVGDEITETEVGDGISEADVGDGITEAEVDDGITKTDVGNGITETEVGDGITEAEVGHRINKAEVGEILDETQKLEKKESAKLPVKRKRNSPKVQSKKRKKTFAKDNQTETEIEKVESEKLDAKTLASEKASDEVLFVKEASKLPRQAKTPIKVSCQVEPEKDCENPPGRSLRPRRSCRKV